MKNAYINYINEARGWKGHEEIKKNSEFTKRIRGSVNKSECYTLHYENKGNNLI